MIFHIKLTYILLFITYQIYPVFGYGLNHTSHSINNLDLDNNRHYRTFASKQMNNSNQKKILNDKPELNSPIDMRDLNKLKYVSLVFASQNFRSPISSFGHTLLVFHNHVTPEPDSPAFEYLGTTSVSFFAVRALFWSIPGYYRLIPWNQKYWEYERENRDIWLVPLKMTATERTELNRLVKESLSVTTDPYNFLFTNCSWYIFKIVQKALKNLNCSVKFYVLPIETLQALQNCGKTGQPFYMPSQTTRVTQSIKTLSPKEKKIIKNLNPWNFPVPQSLDNTNKSLKMGTTPKTDQNLDERDKKNIIYFTDSMKTALTEWIDYTIPRTDDQEKRNELFRLKKHYHYPLKVKQKNMKEIKTKRNGRFTLGLMLGTQWKTAEMTISPGQLSFLNTRDNHFWADKLELFTTSLAFDDYSFFLSSFSLLDMNTSNPGGILVSSFVRDIYVGYKRYVIGLDKYGDNGLVRFGAGLAYDINEDWRFSILPFLESGISSVHTTDNSSDFFFIARLGLTARVFIRFSPIIRIKAEFHQPILTYKTFINQRGSASLVFFDYHSFVSAIHYQTFRIKDNSAFHHSVGLSVSRLF